MPPALPSGAPSTVDAVAGLPFDRKMRASAREGGLREDRGRRRRAFESHQRLVPCVWLKSRGLEAVLPPPESRRMRKWVEAHARKRKWSPAANTRPPPALRGGVLPRRLRDSCHTGRTWPFGGAGDLRFFSRFRTSFIVNALADSSPSSSSHESGTATGAPGRARTP